MINNILKEKYKDEKVYVVPYNEILYIGDKFTPAKYDPIDFKIFDNIGTFMYRYEVEGNMEVQQLIPYVIVFNKDKSKIFTTKRIGGDSRLINKLSIACGGHINEEDEGIDKIFNCAKRELNEELNIEYNISYKFLGFIRDISSNTNDHTGIVLYVTVDNVSVKEKDSLIGKWMTINEIADNYNKLENWSKYLIDYLLENKI